MAVFNNGYPASYQQYYPQYQQSYPQYQQQNTTPQIQNGGFVPVPNIEVARNYQVAPGTSVTFIDENAPYVYTKTRGFSQLEQPVFEKLRLVKEQDEPEAVKPQQAVNTIPDTLKAEYEALRALYDGLREDVDKLKAEWEGQDE